MFLPSVMAKWWRTQSLPMQKRVKSRAEMKDITLNTLPRITRTCIVPPRDVPQKHSCQVAGEDWRADHRCHGHDVNKGGAHGWESTSDVINYGLISHSMTCNRWWRAMFSFPLSTSWWPDASSWCALSKRRLVTWRGQCAWFPISVSRGNTRLHNAARKATFWPVKGGKTPRSMSCLCALNRFSASVQCDASQLEGEVFHSARFSSRIEITWWKSGTTFHDELRVIPDDHHVLFTKALSTLEAPCMTSNVYRFCEPCVLWQTPQWSFTPLRGSFPVFVSSFLVSARCVVQFFAVLSVICDLNQWRMLWLKCLCKRECVCFRVLPSQQLLPGAQPLPPQHRLGHDRQGHSLL